MKKVSGNQTGLKKLPKTVRNKMGYMNKGGVAKKPAKMMAGGMAKKKPVVGYKAGGDTTTKKSTMDKVGYDYPANMGRVLNKLVSGILRPLVPVSVYRALKKDAIKKAIANELNSNSTKTKKSGPK